MAFGLGVLRLSPRDFWAMSPREFEAVARAQGRAPTAPPNRDALHELMAAFPDERTNYG